MKFVARVVKKEPLTRNDKFILLSMFPIYFIVVVMVL